MNAATGGRIAKDASDRLIVRALDDISFEVAEGERLGILGHNGSGKSTLLRVIAGIYKPIYGTLAVKGTINASMLNITLGFDMEASGLENIHLRGLVMGIEPRAINERVDSICAFAELGDFIQLPLRTYSSGMLMRLAFGIATSFSAEIVLMDEWLGVGDADFAQKAQDHLRNMLDDAKVLVLASHDLGLVERVCTRAIRLDHGKIVERIQY